MLAPSSFGTAHKQHGRRNPDARYEMRSSGVTRCPASVIGLLARMGKNINTSSNLLRIYAHQNHTRKSPTVQSKCKTWGVEDLTVWWILKRNSFTLAVSGSAAIVARLWQVQVGGVIGWESVVDDSRIRKCAFYPFRPTSEPLLTCQVSQQPQQPSPRFPRKREAVAIVSQILSNRSIGGLQRRDPGRMRFLCWVLTDHGMSLVFFIPNCHDYIISTRQHQTTSHRSLPFSNSASHKVGTV